MNKVILMGRLTRNPEVRYTQGDNQMAIARYTLAIDRRVRSNASNGEATADFIQCIAFGKSGEFAEKYLHQGTKIVITGRIQTGSYTNKDGQKVYTTDIVVEEQEFAESKLSNENSGNNKASRPATATGNSRQGGWLNVPDDVEDDGLPFN